MAVKPWCTAAVQADAMMVQVAPLHTPVRKQSELVMSESTTGSISRSSNIPHVSCDALTKLFPYAAICTCETGSQFLDHEQKQTSSTFSQKNMNDPK